MADGTSNLFLDVKNKEKDKKSVENRIFKQDKKFHEKFDELKESDNPDYSVLDNMVSQFYNLLSLEYKNASSFMDDELNDFFGIQFMNISLWANMVYCCDSSLLKEKIKKYEDNIDKEFDVYKMRLKKNRDASNQLKKIEYLLSNFNSLISPINPNCYPNGDENEKLEKILADAKSVLNGFNNKVFSLKKGSRVVSDNSLNNNKILPNIDEDDVVVLLDYYISKFSKDKNFIAGMNSNVKKLIPTLYKYLIDLKSKYNSDFDKDYLREALENVRLELYTKLGFDIYNSNVKKSLTKEKHENKVKNNSTSIGENNGVNDSKKDNGSSIKVTDNGYSALFSIISSYIKEFNKAKPLIIDNLNEDYQIKLGKFKGYEDDLNYLLDRVKNKNEDIDSLRNEFNVIQEKIKNDLGYIHKADVAGRRRKVVNVKKALLGIGGTLIGVYGISSLVKEIAFFAKFGFLFPSSLPFALPVGMTVAGAIMIKRALSSSSKKIVDIIGKRLENMDLEEVEEHVEERGRGR